ncbi:MAG TPA: hypothetical protein VHT52_17860 [Stellaceae bacterium]|jgi:hypothetical protein|nr:hypothetical protein [Stellaceae bacterium]
MAVAGTQDTGFLDASENPIDTSGGGFYDPTLGGQVYSPASMLTDPTLGMGGGFGGFDPNAFSGETPQAAFAPQATMFDASQLGGVDSTQGQQQQSQSQTGQNQPAADRSQTVSDQMNLTRLRNQQPTQLRQAGFGLESLAKQATPQTTQGQGWPSITQEQRRNALAGAQAQTPFSARFQGVPGAQTPDQGARMNTSVAPNVTPGQVVNDPFGTGGQAQQVPPTGRAPLQSGPVLTPSRAPKPGLLQGGTAQQPTAQTPQTTPSRTAQPQARTPMERMAAQTANALHQMGIPSPLAEIIARFLGQMMGGGMGGRGGMPFGGDRFGRGRGRFGGRGGFPFGGFPFGGQQFQGGEDGEGATGQDGTEQQQRDTSAQPAPGQNDSSAYPPGTPEPDMAGTENLTPEERQSVYDAQKRGLANMPTGSSSDREPMPGSTQDTNPETRPDVQGLRQPGGAIPSIQRQRQAAIPPTAQRGVPQKPATPPVAPPGETQPTPGTITPDPIPPPNSSQGIGAIPRQVSAAGTPRPAHYTGTVEIGGQTFRYGTGGGRTSSLPYGTYYLHPGAIGPIGRRIGAIAGISDSNNPGNNTVNDPLRLGGAGDHRRIGVELHPSRSGYTNGCFGIMGNWSAFNSAFQNAARQGQLRLTIRPDGSASIAPAGVQTARRSTPLLEAGVSGFSP